MKQQHWTTHNRHVTADEHTEGQLRVRVLDPELVWLTHVQEPWRPHHEAYC
jgi:hypothetical protein